MLKLVWRVVNELMLYEEKLMVEVATVVRTAMMIMTLWVQAAHDCQHNMMMMIVLVILMVIMMTRR